MLAGRDLTRTEPLRITDTHQSETNKKERGYV